MFSRSLCGHVYLPGPLTGCLDKFNNLIKRFGYRRWKIKIIHQVADRFLAVVDETDLGQAIATEGHDEFGHEHRPLRILAEAPGRFFGVTYLDHVQIEVSSHFRAWQVFSSLRPFDEGGDPSTDAQRYEVLSRYDFDPAPDREHDYRMLVSVGPFQVPPDSSFFVEMAFVMGLGQDGLEENALETVIAYDGLWYDLDRNLAGLPDEEALSKISPEEKVALEYVARGPMYWFDPEYDASPLWDEVPFDASLMDAFLEGLLDYDIRTGLGDLQPPVLVIVGRYDFVVPHRLWDEVRAEFPDLAYFVFDESGHTPQLEEPERFMTTLSDWLANHEGGE